MKAVSRQTWSYAVLLVVLCAIAAVAVANTIEYLRVHIPPEQFKLVVVVMWSLTLGFMLIAGSFGLWTIQLSASAEMRRRVGRLIDAMDYIPDALLALDRHARVRGANPALKALSAPGAMDGDTLSDAFPMLSDEDVRRLLDRSAPQEVERDTTRNGIPQTLRFRSQPAEGMTLVLVSDVTAMKTQRLYSRQVARLQLIGEIARGVANDFNTLLCAIATHSSLLARHGLDVPEAQTSVRAISHAADRGISLAGQLLDLSRSHLVPPPSDATTADPLAAAADRIRDSLPESWRIEATCRNPSEAVPLSAIQLEQLIVNLGLLCADSAPEPDTLHIISAPVGPQSIFDVGAPYGVVILVSTLAPNRLDDATADVAARPNDEAGVILSVLRTLVHDSGGRLDVMSSPDYTPVYRLALPLAAHKSEPPSTPALPAEVTSYISRWTVMLALPPARLQVQQQHLSDRGAQVIPVSDISEALARVESNEQIDAIVVDVALLRDFAAGLLRALIKLRPGVAVVILSADEGAGIGGLEQHIVSLPPSAGADRIALAIIEARGQAVRRLHRNATS